MLNIYLSGEIHTDWREEIINLCKNENLNISFLPPRLLVKYISLFIILGIYL